MASENQVRQYLAYWFQLGKKVVIRNGKEALLPKPIFRGDLYSREFEDCWLKITSPDSGDCYLEGTEETIAQLLTSEWEMILCARCPMPIPVRTSGMPASSCPCHDLGLWPNSEIPAPRSPVSSQMHLSSIRARLLRSNTPEDEPAGSGNPNKPPILPEVALELPICPCPIEATSTHN